MECNDFKLDRVCNHWYLYLYSYLKSYFIYTFIYLFAFISYILVLIVLEGNKFQLDHAIQTSVIVLFVFNNHIYILCDCIYMQLQCWGQRLPIRPRRISTCASQSVKSSLEPTLEISSSYLSPQISLSLDESLKSFL